MKKPKLEYLHNEPMIYKYAGQLELYCYELEKKIEKLEKALDNACTRLESFDAMSYCPPEKHWRKEKWKEWCMEDD